jgi:hypothetical protein
MAGDDAKVLFYNGFSYRYALVTTYYTYPEPTPEFAAISSDIQQAFLNALLEWILRAAITHPTSKDQESMVLRVKVSM